MGIYVSQLRAVPVGMYEYYVHLVDASEGAVHSMEIRWRSQVRFRISRCDLERMP
jgi:hypothetical protein